MFEGRVIQVLVASPGDTMDARDAIERTILSWNRNRTKTTRVTLLPQRWEVDSVPEMSGDGQSIINRQLVDEADIVIGLFHARLGRPTIRDKSGTVEEIRRSMERGAIVHVFFPRCRFRTIMTLSSLHRSANSERCSKLKVC